MGRQPCTTHGRQTELLCCPHVCAAVLGKADLDPGDTIEFEVEVKDGGEHVIPGIICTLCGRRSRMRSGVRISCEGAKMAREFPTLTRTCQACVDAWRNPKAVQFGDA